MSGILGTTVTVARSRKPHRCWWCGEVIESESSYVYWTSVGLMRTDGGIRLMHRYTELFPAMRAFGDWVDAEHRAAIVPQDHIPVGSGYLDHLINGTIGDAILRGLRSELETVDILRIAADDYRSVVRSWNRRREWQVHRAESSAEYHVMQVWQRFKRLTKQGIE